MKPDVLSVKRFLYKNYPGDSSDHNTYEIAIFEFDNPLSLEALAGIGVKCSRQTGARLKRQISSHEAH